MNPLRFLFINPELGFDSGHQTLAGASGRHYAGPSVFHREHCCQSIIAEFANERDYVHAMKDLSLKWSMYGNKWIPIPVRAGQVPSPAPAFAPVVEATHPIISPVDCASNSPGFEPDAVNAQTPYKRLVKVAADEGVDIAGCQSNAERAAVIQHARELALR